MFTSLETLETEFFDCEVRLSATQLDARQLKEFASSQMPRSGIGAVPWSTPLSSEKLSELTSSGKAEFVSAHVMLAADGEPPLIGIGALIRDPDQYQHTRMIIVVESESRGQGFGSRIANELIRRLQPGETVQVEVQEALTTQRRRARFFENLGFRCVEETYRVGEVPRYSEGVLQDMVRKTFSLYSYTKDR